MNLKLQRPLLFFDIESTGLEIPADGIIELSFVKIFPGGEQRIKTWKIKPWDYEHGCQRHINPKASEVNGVKDGDLVDCPTFFEVVDEVAEWLRDFKDAKCVYIYDKEDRCPWDEVIKNFENFK